MRKLAVVSVVAIIVTFGFNYHSSADDAKESKSIDALLMKAQKICPVSGDAFDHGEASKTTIDGAVIYLCCDDCKGKQPNQDHLAKITANMIAAQQRCPVMGKALPKNAASVVVEGRRVFVCCKPCIKKVQADPKTYLAKVDAMLHKTLGEKKEKAEQK